MKKYEAGLNLTKNFREEAEKPVGKKVKIRIDGGRVVEGELAEE